MQCIDWNIVANDYIYIFESIHHLTFENIFVLLLASFNTINQSACYKLDTQNLLILDSWVGSGISWLIHNSLLTGFT